MCLSCLWQLQSDNSIVSPSREACVRACNACGCHAGSLLNRSLREADLWKPPAKLLIYPSSILPLGPLWVLLMSLRWYIIYVSASDTSPLDQISGHGFASSLPPFLTLVLTSSGSTAPSLALPRSVLRFISISLADSLIMHKDAWRLDVIDNDTLLVRVCFCFFHCWLSKANVLLWKRVPSSEAAGGHTSKP